MPSKELRIKLEIFGINLKLKLKCKLRQIKIIISLASRF